jgi:hypothetical protein
VREVKKTPDIELMDKFPRMFEIVEPKRTAAS